MLKLPKDISMNELTFALIGKNISHSKSPQIYQELIGKNITYDVLDIQNEEDLPKVSELQKIYRGINITSPYKKAYLAHAELSDSAKKVEAINCLSFKNNKILAANTDYLAIQDFFLKEHPAKKFHCVILGNGVMANCTKIVLQELGITFQKYTRKTDGDITKLDLSSISKPEPLLVINCCSRDYVFQGKLPSGSWFWDFNYNFQPHQNFFKNSSVQYLDGLTLLKTQAIYALKFWEL